jgi:glutathione S-transferase
MSLKLYFAPGACSFVPHVLLEMSGAAFEPSMVKLHKGEQNSEEYKAINPRGQVPVLVNNGQAITQIVAIVLHLDQTFPDAHFLPTEPIARAQALSTLAWMNNTVHPTFTHIFMPQKFSDQPEVHAALKSYNTQLFRGMLGELQALVKATTAKGQTWLTGEHFSPLDAYALTLTRWGTIAGIAPEEHPELWAFVQKVAALPAVARVIERERLQLNMGRPAA